MGNTDFDAEDVEGYVTLGCFGAPYGIKGWVKLISYADPPANILQYRHFMMKTPTGLQQIELAEGRAHGKSFVARVEGCDDRDQTRAYTGRELLVEKAQLPALEGDDYYWFELQDLKVINLAGQTLGRVVRLMETGANDVLVVRKNESAPEAEDILIPFVQDRVVVNVDLEEQVIQVDWEADY